MSARELLDLLRSPYSDDVLAGGVHAVVVPAADLPHVHDVDVPATGSLPIIVIGVGSTRFVAERNPLLDVALLEDDHAFERITTTIATNPVAAAALVVLLRGSAALPVDDALAAESAVYSALQSGAEFARWKASNTRTAAPGDERPPVFAERDGDVLRIVLDRPQRHNAFSRSMRDGLSEMLALAVADDTVTSIELSGNGPSFSSGGDLGEFGTFADPAAAHITRLTRSPARLLHRLSGRTTAHLHGACMGAGIELAAFAGRVVADPDSAIALPELSLGLIPGAGGTVSITRRVGRQRCAQMALSGATITAATALAWGLVDEISPRTAAASRP